MRGPLVDTLEKNACGSRETCQIFGGGSLERVCGPSVGPETSQSPGGVWEKESGHVGGF
jgi:hypothetical protein